MKKKIIVLAVAAIIIVLCGMIYTRNLTTPVITFSEDIQIHSEYGSIHYPAYSAYPFFEDLIWISVYDDGAWRNRKQYLFDLRQEKIIATASPNTDVFTSKKHAVTFGSVITNWRYILRNRVEHWLNLEGQPNIEPVSRLFVMNNETGQQRNLLTNHFPVYLDSHAVSPDGKYLYCSSYSPNGVSQHIVNLENQSLTTIQDTNNYQSGWWSNHEILMKNRQSDVVIFNVETEEQQLVFSTDQLILYIQNQNLHLTQKNMFEIFQYWDGTEYQFLVASTFRFHKYPNFKAPNPKEMWLIKLNKETKGFDIVSTYFPFQDFGYWNQDLSKYIYTEKMEDGTYTLKLYDLKTNATQNVLPEGADVSNETRASFYHDKIIFNAYKNLWMINQDGSEIRQLFPPL